MTGETESRQGRRRRTRAEADQVAAAFEASGLTQAEFSDQHKIPMKTLARYVARRRREQSSRVARPRWVAVEVAPRGETGGSIAVVLEKGRRIEVAAGFDSATLRRVVLELERL